MSKNDDRIVELRKQVAAKKKELKATSSRFAPVTTMTVEVNGTRINIHTLSMHQLNVLACQLQSYLSASAELGIPGNDLVFSGYAIQDWIDDIMGRRAHLVRNEEESRLKKMEAKLDSLLSTDKMTELALDEIAAEL